MKLKFLKLVTESPTIRVSFDGGDSFKEYKVNDIKDDGISFTEDDCPDLTKVIVEGKFKTLKADDISVRSNVTLNDQGEGITYTFEYTDYELTSNTYYCFGVVDQENGSDLPEYIWLKPRFSVDGLETTSIDFTDAFSESTTKIYMGTIVDGTPTNLVEIFIRGSSNRDGFTQALLSLGPKGDLHFTGPNELSYSGIISENPQETDFDPSPVAEMCESQNSDMPDEDVSVEYISVPKYNIQVKRELTPVDSYEKEEFIAEIEDTPTFTENGEYYADEGKAFKSVKVDVGELYMYIPNGYSVNDALSDNIAIYSTILRDHLIDGDPFIWVDTTNYTDAIIGKVETYTPSEDEESMEIQYPFDQYLSTSEKKWYLAACKPYLNTDPRYVFANRVKLSDLATLALRPEDH